MAGLRSPGYPRLHPPPRDALPRDTQAPQRIHYQGNDRIADTKEKDVIDTTEQLAQAVTGTPLAGRTTLRLPVPGGRAVLAVQIEASELLPCWAAARQLTPSTGRAPVAVTTWGTSGGDWTQRIESADLFSRFGFLAPEGTVGVDPDDILARVSQVDLGAFLAQQVAETSEYQTIEEDLEEELEHTKERTGRAPSPDEVAAATLDGAPLQTVFDLDRWLDRWEQSFAPIEAEGTPGGHLDWFQPDDAVALLLLPLESAAGALAYCHWYGADGEPSEPHIALLQSWEERFGAQLVAHWGTMLQFQVDRPPATADQAWQLALEQTLIAPCTIQLPGLSLREHARALIGRDRWFLHERP